MTTALFAIQLIVTILMGIYLVTRLHAQRGAPPAPVVRDSKRELEHLHEMRMVSLTEPLSEKARPRTMADVVGQADGIAALRAALCGPNPQHVLIYGPPGIGKTCAARLVLEEAKRNPLSPFNEHSKFVEIDATCVRFDERSFADPLIGSVHDPIYQGAGAMGQAGIPQPKPGAVTRAHGGMLFLDEIGELPPIQMNKLLKVLEDRKVFLESTYYSPSDTNIPEYIHDVFQNGLPADFRLVGATTRSPTELPPAIRSRCIEVFFRALTPEELSSIAQDAALRSGQRLEEGCDELVGKYASNGREAVSIVQMAAGVAVQDGRSIVRQQDIEWVLSSGQYDPHVLPNRPEENRPGINRGLAVFGPGQGTVLRVEAMVLPAKGRQGMLSVTGVMESEELDGGRRRMRRKSTALCSVESVLTMLRNLAGLDFSDKDVHVNLPGGIPVEGPSAGLAIAMAIFSAAIGRPLDPGTAMTGEISLYGDVLPVGGVPVKIQAALEAGLHRVLIPIANDQQRFRELPIEVVPVSGFEEALQCLQLGLQREEQQAAPKADLLAAQAPAASLSQVPLGNGNPPSV